MPITIPHQKELLSISYATAVAARAGVHVSGNTVHDYGVDLTLSPVSTLPSGKRMATGFDFHFQLKSTVDFRQTPESIIYDLNADTFNMFAKWDGPSPCYLLLMCLPRDCADWTGTTENAMELRKCCYWHHIPPGIPTKNTSSVTISIPRSQVFTHQALLNLMQTHMNGRQP
jgi:hypothetical protein